MKKLLTLLSCYIGITSYAQVGIGTTTPRGALDINNPTESIGGLVLPSNVDATNIKNPQTDGNPVLGTIFYDIENSCVRLYKKTGWSECFCEDCSESEEPTIP